MSFGRTLSVFVSFAALTCVFGFVFSGDAQPPLHALVLFGPEGKLVVRVQVRGHSVRFDKNSDGRFDSDEKFARDRDLKNIELRDPDGTTTYLIKGITYFKETAPSRPSLCVNVHVQGAANYHQYCDATLLSLLQPPAIAHFHGPLSIGPSTINWQVPQSLALRTGDKPTELEANIGTLDAAKKCWTVIEVHDHEEHWLLPAGTFPVVEIEFPAKNSGDPPIKRRYPLEGFC